MLDKAGKILESIIQTQIEAALKPILGSQLHVIDTAKEMIARTRRKRCTKNNYLVATLDMKDTLNSARWDCML